MEAAATDLLRRMCGCDLPARADEDSMDLDAAKKEHAREAGGYGPKSLARYGTGARSADGPETIWTCCDGLA